MLIEILPQTEYGGSGELFRVASDKFRIGPGLYAGIAVVIRPDVPIDTPAKHEEFSIQLTVEQAQNLQKMIQEQLKYARRR